jgi:hypothetical protein
MINSMQKCVVAPSNVLELFQKGVISCVLNQDWTVNRILPEFIDCEKFKYSFNTTKSLLHLGIGDGLCCRFFSSMKNCKQASVSDKLYIDPCDIIKLYLKKCNIPTGEVSLLAKIMRNEFLISMSFEQLREENKVAFNGKDSLIYDLFINMFHTKDTKYSFSYNSILLLLHILNTEPNLLLPSDSTQRVLTPMGKNVVCVSPTDNFSLYSESLNSTISIDDVISLGIEYFGNIENIYLSDFETVIIPAEVQFDYIISARSDAFLGDKYYQFVEKILSNLNKNGIYISDGILNIYNYRMFYRELDELILKLGNERIFFVKSDKKLIYYHLKNYLELLFWEIIPISLNHILLSPVTDLFL